MLALWTRAIITLMIANWVIICILIYKPYNITDVEDFMTSEDNCYGECLLGIQPTVTTVGDAMRILDEHPWVRDVHQVAPGSGYGQITWQWNGQQPHMIDASHDGRLTFYWDRDGTRTVYLPDVLIETVNIYTHIRIYALQAFLGETEMGLVNLHRETLEYSIFYDNPFGLTNLYVELQCPLRVIDFWEARARLTMSIGRINSPFINFTDLETLCDDTQIETSRNEIQKYY